MREYEYDGYRIEVRQNGDIQTVWVYRVAFAELDEAFPEDVEDASFGHWEWLVGEQSFGSWVGVEEMLTAALVDGDILDDESAAEVVAGMLGGVQ